MSPMAILLAAFLSLSAAGEVPDAEAHDDLIHADLPLWADAPDVMWPRSFYEDDSFGCITRVSYGDWRHERHDTESEPTWFRLTSYGVIHCFMMVRDANERAELGGRNADPSFLIELGTAHGREGKVELWILQRGARPGSDYLLLAKKPAPGIVTSFDVLQRRCPRDRVRKGPGLDSLRTDYCAINSRRELAQLARRMAKLPPLGRMTFVGKAEEDEGDEETTEAS